MSMEYKDQNGNYMFRSFGHAQEVLGRELVSNITNESYIMQLADKDPVTAINGFMNQYAGYEVQRFPLIKKSYEEYMDKVNGKQSGATIEDNAKSFSDIPGVTVDSKSGKVTWGSLAPAENVNIPPELMSNFKHTVEQSVAYKGYEVKVDSGLDAGRAPRTYSTNGNPFEFNNAIQNLRAQAAEQQQVAKQQELEGNTTAANYMKQWSANTNAQCENLRVYSGEHALDYLGYSRALLNDAAYRCGEKTETNPWYGTTQTYDLDKMYKESDIAKLRAAFKENPEQTYSNLRDTVGVVLQSRMFTDAYPDDDPIKLSIASDLDAAAKANPELFGKLQEEIMTKQITVTPDKYLAMSPDASFDNALATSASMGYHPIGVYDSNGVQIQPSASQVLTDMGMQPPETKMIENGLTSKKVFKEVNSDKTIDSASQNFTVGQNIAYGNEQAKVLSKPEKPQPAKQEQHNFLDSMASSSSRYNELMCNTRSQNYDSPSQQHLSLKTNSSVYGRPQSEQDTRRATNQYADANIRSLMSKDWGQMDDSISASKNDDYFSK